MADGEDAWKPRRVSVRRQALTMCEVHGYLSDLKLLHLGCGRARVINRRTSFRRFGLVCSLAHLVETKTSWRKTRDLQSQLGTGVSSFSHAFPAASKFLPEVATATFENIYKMRKIIR